MPPQGPLGQAVHVHSREGGGYGTLLANFNYMQGLNIM